MDDITDLGYDKYRDYLYALILTPKDVADVLWCQMKIWYEDIKSDWGFFLENSLVGARNITLCVNDKITEGIGVNEELKDALNFFFCNDYEYIIMDKKTEDTGNPSNALIVGADYTDSTRSVCVIKENFKIKFKKVFQKSFKKSVEF